MAIALFFVGTAVQGNVASTSVTSQAVDLTGVTTGEVCFVFGTVGDAQSVAITAPSGWNLLGQSSEGTTGSASSRTIVLWRVIQAGDTTVTVSWGVAAPCQFVAAQFTGLNTTTPTEGLTWLAHTTGTTYTTGTATPTAGDRWAVGVFSARGTTAVVSWALSAPLLIDNNTTTTTNPFTGLAFGDSNGVVTQASHAYTATGQSSSHGLGAVMYLIPATVPVYPRRPRVTPGVAVGQTSRW